MMSFSHVSPAVALPLEFIQTYMVRANATYVKVYLYGLGLCYSNAQEMDNAKIAEALDILESDVMKAWRYWKKQGLVRSDGRNSLVFEHMPLPAEAANSAPAAPSKQETVQQTPPSAVPVPTMKEIERAMKLDPQMGDTIKMAETILKKPLTRRETEALYNMLDWYGMSKEVVLMLLEHCVSEEKTNLAYIVKVAENWYNMGITTAGAAEKQLMARAKAKSFQQKCRKIFGLDRNFSDKEAEFLTVWNKEYAMKEDMIRLAYDKTVLNTGKLSFPYMNKILKTWHEGGIHTPAQVEQRDTAAKQGGSESGGYVPDEMAALERRRRLKQES